jgi:hypothetical protein
VGRLSLRSAEDDKMSEYRKTMEYQLGKLRLISAAHETLRKWLEEVAEGRKLQAVLIA